VIFVPAAASVEARQRGGMASRGKELDPAGCQEGWEGHHSPSLSW